MTPHEAYIKCEGKINKDLEPYLIKDPYYAYLYARDVKGRWIEAEPIIINSVWAYYYARNVIKGRWIEAEQHIINDSASVYLYARDIIKGKLPENMHNMMLLHADLCAKEYLEFIKNKP
jgi:hypothetical protein